jgi:hypothetical protein
MFSIIGFVDSKYCKGFASILFSPWFFIGYWIKRGRIFIQPLFYLPAETCMLTGFQSPVLMMISIAPYYSNTYFVSVS